MNKQSLAMAYSIKRMSKTGRPKPVAPVLEEPAVKLVDDLEPVPGDVQPLEADEPEKPTRASLIASIIRKLKA